MNSQVKDVGMVAVAIAMVVVAVMALGRVDKYLLIKAIDDCGRTGQFNKSLPEESATITYPVGDVYQNCLKEKGYEIATNQ